MNVVKMKKFIPGLLFAHVWFTYAIAASFPSIPIGERKVEICTGQLWVHDGLIDVSPDATGKTACYILNEKDRKKVPSVCRRGKPCTVEGDLFDCEVESGPSYECIKNVRNIKPSTC
jgi:hypothetical protein